MPDRIYTLPLFPLEVVLYPYAPLPLHIFEERYKAMIEHCLSEDLPFGVLLSQEEHLAAVGSTARIVDVMERHADGRIDVMTEGQSRFRHEHISEDAAGYLIADAETIDDVPDPVSAELRERVITLHMKLLELAGHTVRPNFYEDRQGALSYVLARNAGLSLSQKQDVLELPSETERFHYLADHFGELLPRVEERESLRQHIQSNGHFEDF